MSLQRVKLALGSPYFESEQFVLYNRDCLSSMSDLPPELFDLTVTSPPYNIGKSYETKQDNHRYLEWCESWMTQVHRLTASHGAFWLNLGYFEVPGQGKAVPITYLLWDKSPFFMLQEVVWNYGAGVHTSKIFSPRNEKFIWYVKNPEKYIFNLDDVRDPDVKYPNQKKNGKFKCNPLGKNPSDVWQIPKVTSGTNRASKERMPHPAQFPLTVIDRIIRASSNENDLILDPFMGSGTTAIGALETGRPVVGFEISEQYCELAAKRVEEYLSRRANRSEQTSLILGI